MYAVLAHFFQPGAEQVAAVLCIRIMLCNESETKEDKTGPLLKAVCQVEDDYAHDIKGNVNDDTYNVDENCNEK